MSGTRSRWVAGGVLAATFLAGAVVGAAGYRVLDSPEASAAPERPPERTAGGERRRDSAGEDRGRRDRGPTSEMLEILRRDVGITASQEKRVRAILERREERAHEVFEGVRERFHRWMDTTVTRIQAVLDEEQAVEFERRLEARMEERRRRRHGEDRDEDAPRP